MYLEDDLLLLYYFYLKHSFVIVNLFSLEELLSTLINRIFPETVLKISKQVIFDIYLLIFQKEFVKFL